MSVSNEFVANEFIANESVSNKPVSDESVFDESGSDNSCDEDGCDYTVSIKLNIPVLVEPKVFTQSGTLSTNQKFQIRIQPNIQISPEVKASITQCVTQESSDRSDTTFPFPELIVEGLFEES